MEKRKGGNPVFSSIMSYDYAEEKDNSNCASYLGVSIKTMFLLAVAVSTAIIGVNYIPVDAMAGGMIFGLFVCLISSFLGYKIPAIAMPCSIIYALFEGLFLGAITVVFDFVYPGVAVAAVTATAGIFGIMLLLYTTGVIRGGTKFRAIVISSLLGILLMNVVILISGIWTNDLIEMFYGNGIVALLVAIFIVIIAACSLIIDFATVTDLVEGGFEKKYEWVVSLGLMVSIVYLYIQIIRLLAIIASHAKD